MDEGYFTIEASEQTHKTQKSGSGSKTKSNVMIMAESTILENVDTGKVERQCMCFKAKVLQYYKSDGNDDTFQNVIGDEKTIVLHKWKHFLC